MNRIDIKEFRDRGYLQEVNRQFFHPLGMALFVEIEPDGKVTLGGVLDYRSDPEGMLYEDDMLTTAEFQEKQKRVAEEWFEKTKVRMEKFGFTVQEPKK